MNYSFESISDIIKVLHEYKSSQRKRKYGAKLIVKNNDLERLLRCLEPLEKLDALIGMDSIKKSVIDQILFYAQKLNTSEMMHVCLTGPPGVGKTTLINVLAEIYSSLGFLENGEVKFATRDSLIGGYLGQTAIKTKKVLKEALGCTLVIDEIYSLGVSKEDSDTYAHECVNTINQFLSENKENILVIVAGYKEHVQNYFFSMNPGLERRFPWRYEMKEYTPSELNKIFQYQVEKDGWEFSEDINFMEIEKIFSIKDYFKNNGGSTEHLKDRCKIVHARRVFGKSKKYKKILTIEDIKLAFEQIKVVTEIKKDTVPYGMYL